MSSKYPTPEREGHWWAKLKLAEDGHKSVQWEVVQVFDNIMRPWCEADIETGECMMAHVPGIEQSYPLDAFAWGPSVHLPPELERSTPSSPSREAEGDSDGGG